MRCCKTPFFCVLNPDIRIPKNPFPKLIKNLQNPKNGVCAPKILGLNGKEEDSHRQFPNFKNIITKIFKFGDGRITSNSAKLFKRRSWLGGMFLIFRTETLRKVHGFDEKFFLYYEDVDLCARLIREGFAVQKVPSVIAIHDARRQSRRDIRYTFWHLKSMARFLIKQAFGFYRLPSPGG